MFIARPESATLLGSEERHSFEPRGDRPAALPNRAEGGWLAGYKHCTPPEWKPCFVRVPSSAKGSLACRQNLPAMLCTTQDRQAEAYRT